MLSTCNYQMEESTHKRYRLSEMPESIVARSDRREARKDLEQRNSKMLIIVLIIVLVLVFGGGGGYYGYGRWGAGGGAGIGLGTVLLILLVCYMLGLFR